MAWCKCSERPKCERSWCDQWADVSDWQVDWTVLQRPFTEAAAERASRPIFMCQGCFDGFIEASTRWWHQIDRPKHADENWRGSIIGHVRWNLMMEAAEQRKHGPQQTVDVARDFRPIVNHQKLWNPQQRAQAEYMRRVLREMRDGHG